MGLSRRPRPRRAFPRRRLPLLALVGVLMLGVGAGWGLLRIVAPPEAAPAPSIDAPFSLAPVLESGVSVSQPAPSLSGAVGPGSSTSGSPIIARPSSSTHASARATLGPQQLAIPSLEIVASYSDEALVNGSLTLPDDPTRLARYAAGAGLGDAEGHVLLSGHVAFNGVPGALSPLWRIRPGAQVYVTDRAGTTSQWSVTSLAQFPKANLPPSVFSRTGPRTLVLVTCGGPVVTSESADGRVTHRYRDNIVVTAVPVRT